MAAASARISPRETPPSAPHLLSREEGAEQPEDRLIALLEQALATIQSSASKNRQLEQGRIQELTAELQDVKAQLSQLQESHARLKKDFSDLKNILRRPMQVCSLSGRLPPIIP